MSKFCAHCGKPISDTGRFCPSCGKQIPVAPPIFRTAPAPAPAPAPTPTYAYPYAPPSVRADYGCAVQRNASPVGQLKTNKGLLKYILLSLITFGIYGLVAMSSVSNDINIVASRYDGRRTMHYCLLFFLISPITFGIASIVWFHKISNRIGNELKRRQINYSFSCVHFWLWNVLGSFIFIGPFVYYHKLFKATNLMCANYNVNG